MRVKLPELLRARAVRQIPQQEAPARRISSRFSSRPYVATNYPVHITLMREEPALPVQLYA